MRARLIGGSVRDRRAIPSTSATEPGSRPDRRRRCRSGLLAAVVLLPLLLPTAAVASHLRVQDVVDACAGAPEDGLGDVGKDGAALETAVDCLGWYGVTSGTAEGTYGPGGEVSRAQLATMVATVLRDAEKPFVEPAADERDRFPDDDGSPHEPNIDFVAHHGIVNGYGDGTFRPDERVTREQMASFLARVLTAAGFALPGPADDAFDDAVTPAHDDAVRRLAALGVVVGVEHRTFQGGGAVRRSQVAHFLTRTLDELVESRHLRRPDERGLTVDLAASAVVGGGTITGTADVPGGQLDAVVVSGCGLGDRMLTDEDGTRPGVQFSVDVPDRDPGTCELGFRTP
ncbi:MAG: S-layer homology domain-containing protein [Nitriliruptorales bacterium]